MPAGDALTDDRQIELAGQVLGAGAALGDATVHVLDFRARVLPSIRSSDSPLTGMQGVAAGTDLLGERRVAAQLLVQADDEADLIDAIELLTGLWAPTPADQWLAWLHADRVRFYWGRTRGAEPDDATSETGAVVVDCRFVAVDPRAYGDEQTEDGAGTFNVTNDGTVPTSWTLTVEGEATEISVAFGDTLIEWVGEAGSGDVVVIGTMPRPTATLSGDDVPVIASWGDLPVGTTEVIVTVTGTPSSVVFAWRDAFA